MSLCGLCSASLSPENDYTTCGGCKGNFHYACANVRETAWRKYSQDVKLSWKCAICKTKTVQDNVKLPVSEPIQTIKIDDKTQKPTTLEVFDNKSMEITYLQDLLRHKDRIIENQSDLIASLKEQILLLKGQFSLKTTRRPSPTEPASLSSSNTHNVATIQLGSVAKSTCINSRSKVVQSDAQREQAKNVSGGLFNAAQDCKEGESTAVTVHDLHEALTRVKYSEVINLPSEVRDGKNSFKSRQRTSNKPIIGAKPADNLCKLRAAKSYTHWHIYRLHPTTSTKDILDYLGADFPSVRVEQLKSHNPDDYSSFKVSVEDKDKEKICDASLWPSGARINRFFLSKNRQ